MDQIFRNGFSTSNGRHISVSELHILRTYAGQLEGSYESCSHYIREGLRDQIARHLSYPEALVILDNGEKALPTFQWIAMFESSPVHTSDPDYSSRLRVCWFTEHMPNDLTETIQATVDKVDYEASAEDYDTMW